MSSPLVDATASIESSAGVTTLSWTHTTGQANCALRVGVATSVSGSGAAPVVSSVSISGGLGAFTKRKAVNVTGMNAFVVGTFGMNCETWFVPVPTAGTYTITVVIASAALEFACVSMSTYNLCNASIPYDENGSLVASGDSLNLTGSAATTFSTTEKDDLLIACLGYGAQTGAVWDGSATNYTTQVNVGNSGQSLQVLFATLSVSAVQSGATASGKFSGIANGGAIILLDADTHGTNGVCPGMFKLQTFVS